VAQGFSPAGFAALKGCATEEKKSDLLGRCVTVAHSDARAGD
jgi:hypothetical protein